MNPPPDPRPPVTKTELLLELLICFVTASVAYWLLESWPDMKSGFADGFVAGWEAVRR